MRKTRKSRIQISKATVMNKLIFKLLPVIIILLFSQCHCREFEKPQNVPEAAKWYGGCDGGNWIELVRIKGDTIRLRIYHDTTGDLIIDSDFLPPKDYQLHLTTSNWHKYIGFFDGSKLITDVIKENNNHLTLTPILPAYYEEWYEWYDFQANEIFEANDSTP